MLLIDKYRIKTKQDLVFHKNIYHILENFRGNELPNIILYGKSGVGKKSLINLFLKNLYGEEVNLIREQKFTINGYSNSSVDIIIKKSNFHIIIKPENSGLDKYIIQEVIREYAQNFNIRSIFSDIKFKIILIKNAEKLSYHAQTSLRFTMERCAKNCRFILVTKEISKIITPLKSRCVNIRIPKPTYNEIFETLFKLSIQENINLTQTDYHNLIINSNQNIKMAIWLLDIRKYNILNFNQWENTICNIVKMIINCKLITNKFIMDIRKSIYTILISNINPIDLLTKLMIEFINNSKSQINLQIIEETAKYNLRIANGKRYIIHFEAYLLSIFNIIKNIEK